LSVRNRVPVVCRSGLHPFTAVIGVRWFTRTPSRSACIAAVSVPSTGLREDARVRVSSFNDRRPHPLCRPNRRSRCCAHTPAARSSRPLADHPGSTTLPLPAPLARRLRCLVHPPARSGRLARDAEPESPAVIVCR